MNYLKKDFYQLVRRNEPVFDFIENFSMEGFLYLDLEDSDRIWMNPKCALTLGWDKVDLAYETFFLEDLIFKEDVEGLMAALLQKNGQINCVNDCSIRYKHKNGLAVWTSSCGIVVKNETGKTLGLIIALKEIQAGMGMGRLLEDTNRLARIGTWEIDLNSNIPVWSSVTKEIHEVAEDYIPDLSTAINFFKEGESRQNISEAVDAAIKEGRVFDMELQIITAEGQEKWVRAIGLTQLKDGKCLRIYGTFQDITERKNIEDKLRISEESFRSAFEHAAIGMALVNPSGKWLQTNDSLSKMVGYSAEELANLTFQEITHPEDLHTDLHLLEELVAGKRESYQMEKRYFYKDGHIVWAILAVSLVSDAEGKLLYFVSQITDITKSKVAEQKLQLTLSELEGISNASYQVSIIGTDVNGMVTFFNKGSENLLGYTPDELQHQHVSIFHDQEEIALRSAELTALFKREITGFEVFTQYAKLGEFETREWTYIRKDGTRFPVQLVATAIKNHLGDIHGFLGIATDISNIKAVENELKIVLDVTSDQNKRLLNFAHIVSHNLRSHSGNLAMLLDFIETEKDETARKEMFFMLRDAAANLQDTIDHLNEVVVMNSQMQESLKQVNLAKAIDSAIGNVNALLKVASGKCINSVPAEYIVDAVPAYLDSILLNFLTNAIKYRSEKRELLIEISARAEGNFIVLSIKDNGLGIDLKVNGDKLFGMYKTFHKHKDSRGIGLFITKNQIEAMGGTVSAESEVDKGTMFTVYLKRPEDKDISGIQ